MVTCDETTKLLDAYIDQELYLNDSLVIEKHLRVCKQCEEKYKNILALQQAVKTCKRHRPPAELQDSIQNSLKLESRTGLNIFRHLRESVWLKFALPSFSAGVIVSAILLSSYPQPPKGNTIFDEVVDSHVRSMMYTHLTDVSTSDKHQIKPWINKELDYSAPVEDLTHEGFPLVGARLDYINQRKVVSLVYQLRKHYINVFIWPVVENNDNTVMVNQKGYRLQYWTANKLAFAAATDLAGNDLERFVRVFKTATLN